MNLPLSTGGIFIEVDNLPVNFVIDRASDVPADVMDEESEAKAGITGNDILWEAGLGKDTGEPLPIPSGGIIFAGVTESYKDEIRQREDRDVTIADFSDITVATKFPNIAKDVFAQNNVDRVTVRYAPGKTEAKQYLYPQSKGILDVYAKGTTAKANGLVIVERVLDPVAVRMIDAGEQLTERDREILADLRTKLTVRPDL